MKTLTAMIKHQYDERGFSMGEFAILLAVFGLLTGIALPAYLSYRIQTFNSFAKSDVLNLGLSVMGTSRVSDCRGEDCESTYRGFAKSSCSEIATASVPGDRSSAVIVGCCEGGSKGYMFSAASGVMVEFPLSTGTCVTAENAAAAVPGGIEG